MRKPRYAPGSRQKPLPAGYEVDAGMTSLGYRWMVLRDGALVSTHPSEDAARSSARKHAVRHASV